MYEKKRLIRLIAIIVGLCLLYICIDWILDSWVESISARDAEAEDTFRDTIQDYKEKRKRLMEGIQEELTLLFVSSRLDPSAASAPAKWSELPLPPRWFALP